MIHSTNIPINIFADGANLFELEQLCANPLICGFTTNPSLMRKAGVSSYSIFARQFLKQVPSNLSVSFEVVSDEFEEMERQARVISAWGHNVYVKIPIVNTQGLTSTQLIHKLSHSGVKINVTAVFTRAQAASAVYSLAGGAPSYISIFAGRIADTGTDPVELIQTVREIMTPFSGPMLLWASARELYNVVQAHDAGCHIITLPKDLIAKLHLLGKNLFEYSKETVRMFHQDAISAGLHLNGE